MSSRATALVDDGQGNSLCGRLSAIHALMAISEPTGFIGTPLPDINWTERNVPSNDTVSGNNSASIIDTVLEDLNVTATDVSDVDAEKYQETFNTGDTSRRPITDPYFLYKSMDILMGLNSPIIKVCRFDGCEDEVFEIPSDDKFQLDIGEMNQKTYSPTGYCRKHLMGSKKCEFSGCDKCSQGSTKFCIKHGGGRRCTIEGCDKGARDKQFCAGHGGGKRCSVASCNKSAVGGSGHCCVHGGGKKCTFEGCFKSAQSPTQFCVKHGGGKTCITEGCIKVSRGTTSHCAGHGGGTRCSFRECNKAAMSSNDVCRIHSGFSNTISKPKKVKYVKSQSLSNCSEKKNPATCENNEYDAIHDNSDFVNPLPSDDLYLGPDDHELFYDDEYPNSDDSKGATIIENHRISTCSKSPQHVSYFSHNSVTADGTYTQSSNGRSLTAEVCVPCLAQVKGALPSKHSSAQLLASPRNEVSCGSYIERLPRSESDAFESMFSNYRNGAGNYEGNSIVSGAASVYGSPSRMGQEKGSADRSGDEEVRHGLHQSSSLNDVLQALDRIGKPQYFDSCLGLELRRASVPLAVTYNPYQHMGSTIFNNAAHNYNEREGLSHGRQQLHSPSSNSFPYSSLIPMPLPSLLPASSLLASISDSSCFKIFRKTDNDSEKGLLRQPEQVSSSSTSSSSSSTRSESEGDSCSLEGSQSKMKGSSTSDIYADRSFHESQSRYKTLDGTPSMPSLMRTSSSLKCPTALNTRGFPGDQSPLLRGTQTSSLLSAATSRAFERSGVIDSVPRFYARRNSFDGCSSSEVDVFGNRSAANSSSKSDSNSHSHSNSNKGSGTSREEMGFTGLGLSLPLPLPPAASGGERPKIFESRQAVSPSLVFQKQALPPPNPLALALPLSLSPPPMRHLHGSISNKSPESIAGHLEPHVGSADHSATNWTSRGGSEDSDADADRSVRRDSIDMMDSSFAADILLAYAAQTHEPYIDTSSELKRSNSQPSLQLFHRDSNGQEDVKSKESYDTIQTIISISEEHGAGLYTQNEVRDQFFLPSRQSSTVSAHNTRKRVRGDRDGVRDEVGV